MADDSGDEQEDDETLRVSSWDAYYSRLGFLLRRCHQASVSVFVEECASFDLTPTQFGVLCSLNLTPNMDQIGVARAVGLDRSTAGSVVDRLVKRGLITRVINATDRRRRTLKLTEKGVSVMRAAEPASQAAQRRMLQNLSAEEAELLMGLLTKLMHETHKQNRVMVKNPQHEADRAKRLDLN